MLNSSESFAVAMILSVVFWSACYESSETQDEGDATPGTDGDSDGDSGGDHCNLGTYEDHYVIKDNTTRDALIGYTAINGKLSIEVNSSYGPTNLSGLECLKKITGDLNLVCGGIFTSFEGLDNLEELGGSLNLDSDLDPGFGSSCVNPLLSSLKAFSKLKKINGDLIIYNYTNLINLEGFENVSEVVGSVRIGGIYTSVESLKGFDGLVSVGGNFELIMDANNIDALNKLTTIGGDLKMIYVATENLDALSNLTSIGGSLILKDGLTSLVIEDITGLSNVSHIGANVSIFGLDIVNLHPVDKMETINGKLSIGGNPNLESFSFPNLVSIAAGLDIGSSEILNDFVFPRLASIGDTLVINSCEALEMVSESFPDLVELDGDLRISGNSALPTCDVEILEEQLRDVGWTGDSEIAWNDSEGICE